MLLAGLRHIACETRVLRAYLAVDVGGHVPRLLDAERATAAEGHVGVNKLGRAFDGGHPRAPIVGPRAPQRREHDLAPGRLSVAVRAVACGALLRIDLAAARIVGGQRRLWQFRESPARRRFAG